MPVNVLGDPGEVLAGGSAVAGQRLVPAEPRREHRPGAAAEEGVGREPPDAALEGELLGYLAHCRREQRIAVVD